MSFIRTLLTLKPLQISPPIEEQKSVRTFSERLEKVERSSNKVPSLFCDAITFELMNDPLAIDNVPDHTIDRSSLEWCCKKDENNNYLNPLTSQPIYLLPNNFDIANALTVKEELEEQLKNNNLDSQTRNEKNQQLNTVKDNLSKCFYTIDLKDQIDKFLTHLEKIKNLKSALEEFETPLEDLESLVKKDNIEADQLEKLIREKNECRKKQIFDTKHLLIDALEKFIVDTANVIRDINNEKFDKNTSNQQIIDEQLDEILGDDIKWYEDLLKSLLPEENNQPKRHDFNMPPQGVRSHLLAGYWNRTGILFSLYPGLFSPARRMVEGGHLVQANSDNLGDENNNSSTLRK
jgi:hypothetical protein